ncbi:MAG: alpha/beta fold hydrolase [Candidatus Lokiarchaeota archaeon]|nr:alpha/beta fold hydrolase [Candidatus Lokiarchaeota archaeon]
MADMKAQVNGIELCYKISGSGYPLILIHGYGGQKEDWLPQVIELSKYFKIIYFDNRCSGESDHPNQPIKMETFVQDLKSVMDFLGIQKAHIAGRSLGGMIVQQFLVSYPEMVNKVILINTHYSGEMGEIIVQSSLNSLSTKNVNPEEVFWNDAMFLFHSSFRRELKKNPTKKFYNLFTLNDLINKFRDRTINKEDLINQGYSFKNFNLIDKLSSIKRPILLIGAENDRILPHSQMIEMHKKLPNSRLVIIKKAGHGSPISKAPKINELIKNFLQE